MVWFVLFFSNELHSLAVKQVVVNSSSVSNTETPPQILPYDFKPLWSSLHSLWSSTDGLFFQAPVIPRRLQASPSDFFCEAPNPHFNGHAPPQPGAFLHYTLTVFSFFFFVPPLPLAAAKPVITCWEKFHFSSWRLLSKIFSDWRFWKVWKGCY